MRKMWLEYIDSVKCVSTTASQWLLQWNLVRAAAAVARADGACAADAGGRRLHAGDRAVYRRNSWFCHDVFPEQRCL
jgi:hypothetical protein